MGDISMRNTPKNITWKKVVPYLEDWDILNPSSPAYDEFRFQYNEYNYEDPSLGLPVGPGKGREYGEINYQHPGWNPDWGSPGTVRFYTYGDPADGGTPYPKTGFGPYRDLPKVYGDPDAIRRRQIQVLPEDARSMVFDVVPNRINHAKNPEFKVEYEDGLLSWSLSNATRTTTALPIWQETPGSPNGEVPQPSSPGPPPWGSRDSVGEVSGLRVSPGGRATFSQINNPVGSTWVSPISPDGSSGADSVRRNWWKMAFVTDAREAVYGGFFVLSRDGVLSYRQAEFYPQPLPWDTDWDRPYGPHPGCWNPHMYSRSGWYMMYAVVDLGVDAEWATFRVGMTEAGKSPAFITDLCVERWDTIDLLTGPGAEAGSISYIDLPYRGLSPVLRPGDNRAYDDPNSYANLFIDPLPTFNGDMISRHMHDLVWLGEPDEGFAISGYLPQRIIRTDGYERLVRNWLPIGRTESLRPVYEVP